MEFDRSFSRGVGKNSIPFSMLSGSVPFYESASTIY